MQAGRHRHGGEGIPAGKAAPTVKPQEAVPVQLPKAYGRRVTTPKKLATLAE